MLGCMTHVLESLTPDFKYAEPSIPVSDVPHGIAIMTAQELFVPGWFGEAPVARRILDEVTSMYPVDANGHVREGIDELSGHERVSLRGISHHPYVFLEQIKPADGTIRVPRPGKEFFVGKGELYQVTVSDDKEVAEVRDRTNTHETFYSRESGRVTVLVPRMPKPKQTFFPGGMNSITSTD